MSERAPKLRLTEAQVEARLKSGLPSGALGAAAVQMAWNETVADICHDAKAAHALKRERDAAEARLAERTPESSCCIEDGDVCGPFLALERELAAERQLRLSAEAKTWKLILDLLSRLIESAVQNADTGWHGDVAVALRQLHAALQAQSSASKE